MFRGAVRLTSWSPDSYRYSQISCQTLRFGLRSLQFPVTPFTKDCRKPASPLENTKSFAADGAFYGGLSGAVFGTTNVTAAMPSSCGAPSAQTYYSLCDTAGYDRSCRMHQACYGVGLHGS